MTRREALERFRKLSPEERLTLAEQAAGAKALIRLTRADLVVSVVARGTIEAAQASDISCAVRGGTSRSTGSTLIKWIVDEGTFVKKGDKLVELDSSAFQEELRDKTRDVAVSLRDKVGSEEELKTRRVSSKAAIRSSEIALKLTKLDLKKCAGTDADEKEALELKVEQAQLGLDTIKREFKGGEAKAAAEVKANSAILEQATARKRDIEAEIAKCTVKAPHDGLVVYYVPEQVRGGGTQQPVVAQGEPVREGQKMIRICNLEHFTVTAKVHESLISRVRVRQQAELRVDAFARRVLHGRVTSIATMASAQDWFASDVKLFNVRIALTDKLPGLKPGMSADVRVEIERLPKVLQVPLESVVRIERETFCYVKVGKGLHERKVKTGARNDLDVEITDGLKEDEQVLRSPAAVARSSARTTGWGPGAPASARVLARSMRVPPASGGPRRTWVESYGLTYTDLARIRALPDIVSVAPVRSFPAETHFLERFNRGHVIATVPEYRELTGVRLAAGRFLDDEDSEGMKNVAVLGADVAESLFSEEEPLGKVVRVNRSAYVVVGVLEEQVRPAGGLTVQEANRGVYLPLRTARARFGARVLIRRGNRRTAEAVELSEILVGTGSTRQAAFVAASISDLLEEAHSSKDWDVRVSNAR
jgi:multidrug efflux pump subunit AcrA (membrane-fusion protein)